ncbi:helix-turn-helix domain-containing protein [Paractinoplanes hotanensis]|uniref:Helix-turn-helix transcriptional regulator n=1 Tax=Paractinoplanes hotanensis TaxID=2906497 RepID=A0ABT0Y1M0_9ACTN|nr:helix-turn-helix transcriptional regulator [Actinoplanes hotanensis]MCM4079398.1 helix-turn-helix transcriptional regulator [Actinoplanes hotanensis]
MAEGESPTIARRRVRIAIREAREALPLTQAQVAEEMEWSLSKVIRIENGDVSISINDLRGLLNLLGIRDKAIVEPLLADARIARTRKRSAYAWWEEPRFRENTSEPFRRFLEYEAEATELRSFNVYYVHGPLQTPEYARALTGAWLDDEFTEAQVDALVEIRGQRREAMLHRSDPLKYYFLADQSVFMRLIGGLDIFIPQLQQIVELAESGLFQMRMLPFDIVQTIANNGSFELLTVDPSHPDREVMYRENGVADETVENLAETRRHRKRFNQLWQAAMDESDTIAFVRKRIEDLGATSPGVEVESN